MAICAFGISNYFLRQCAYNSNFKIEHLTSCFILMYQSEMTLFVFVDQVPPLPNPASQDVINSNDPTWAHCSCPRCNQEALADVLVPCQDLQRWDYKN